MDETKVMGISLRQYVSVHERVAAGEPLEAVLLEHGLDDETWLEVDAEVAERLADSLDGDGALLDEHDRILGALQDARLRADHPLCRDLGLFLDFARHLSSPGSDARDLLGDAGLDAATLARIFGAWADRLGADAALRDRAFALLAQPPGPAPLVRVAPSLTLLDGAPSQPMPEVGPPQRVARGG